MARLAREWKEFYALERERLGLDRMRAMFDDAPRVSVGQGRVSIFPHTRLEITGGHVAAVARAVVDSGADEVLAIGVLHGARACDAESVHNARNGDGDARARLRRVHSGDDDHASEEFSLDAFIALVELAAERANRASPRIITRFPFLVGDAPHTLPGIDDLARLAERLPVVATTDPIHHGIGYGDTAGLAGAAAIAWATSAIEAQLDALTKRDWSAFVAACADARSDFRDVGPALAYVLPMAFEIIDLALVDYAEALSSPSPTWVAGALIDGTIAR